MTFTDVAHVVGERSGQVGRYVVAARDLRAGEQVLVEEPAVLGPKQGSALVCIQCCVLLPTIQDRCGSCGLPLCPSCSASLLEGGGSAQPPIHLAECEIFQKNGLLFSGEWEQEVSKVYPSITVLRCLLSDTISHLENHAKEREDTPVWLYNQKFTIPFLTSLRDSNGSALFHQEKVHEATGVLDTNTFDVKGENIQARALFPTASLLNNSCYPNCMRTVSPANITITTTRPVYQGEELTICYTGLLTPNHIRQAVFKQTKHFLCTCRRCNDPSEGGSHPTALACRPCGGLVLAGICQDCRQQMDTELMEQTERLCNTLVSRLLSESDCDILLSGLSKCRKLLSRHHYLLVQLKLKLLDHASGCGDCNAGEESTACAAEMADLLKLFDGSQTIDEVRLQQEKLRENHTALASWHKHLL